MKGETCTSNDECNSSFYGQVLKVDYTKGGGTTTQLADEFKYQCYGIAAKGTCEEDDDCQSGRCRENNNGKKECLRISAYDDNSHCTKHTDCSSGFCNFFTNSEIEVEFVTIFSKKDPIWNSYRVIWQQLISGTNPSIDKKDSFSVSLWFKTNSTSPMMITTQRDTNTYLGSHNFH